MIFPKERRPYWIGGIIASALGLGLDRAASLFPMDQQMLVHGIGRVLALVGLFVIMLGTRKRIPIS